MRVFITGVAGFLGSHLADALLADGHDVIGCDNLIGGYLDNVPEDVDFHQVDCGYLNTMNKLLRNVDVLYHCACTAYEGLSVFSPHLVVENTAKISATVFSAAMEQGVSRVVFCSSMARYGTQDTVPFLETMDPRPQDPYGIAKVAAEDILRILCEVNNREYVICVPHNIIGPRQKYDDPFRNVASIMINLMLQGRQPIIYGDGSQKRCFSFVKDVVGCLVKLIHDGDAVGEVINIGPDEEFVEINELAETIADLLDFDLDPVYVAERPQEVKYATCSADKAREMLGYNTTYTLKQGLGEMIDWIQNRGTKRFRYHLDLEITNGKCPVTWRDRMF